MAHARAFLSTAAALGDRAQVHGRIRNVGKSATRPDSRVRGRAVEGSDLATEAQRTQSRTTTPRSDRALAQTHGSPASRDRRSWSATAGCVPGVANGE